METPTLFLPGFSPRLCGSRVRPAALRLGARSDKLDGLAAVKAKFIPMTTFAPATEQPKARPKFFDVRTGLSDAGELADTPAGREKCGEYLAWQAAEGPAGRNKADVSMSKGWRSARRNLRRRW